MQNIFSIIITFLSFSSALSMELPDLATLQSYIDNAEKASTQEEKWKWYGKVTGFSFPPDDPAYSGQRKLKRKAYVFIFDEAKKFTDQGEYTKALKVYSYAPKIAQSLIEALKKLEPFQDQIQQAIRQKKFEDIYKIFDRPELKDDLSVISLKIATKGNEQKYYFAEAQEAKERGDRKSELGWLGKIVDMELYGHGDYFLLQEFQSKIFRTIRKEALAFENQKDYDKALEIYMSAPKDFEYEIKRIDALKRFQKTIQDKNFQEAIKILASPELRDKAEVQNLKPSIEIQYYMQRAREAKDEKEALGWYGWTANTFIPQTSVSGVDIYKDIRPLKQEAMNKISQKATDLKSKGIYDEALKLYKLAPQTFENQIQALQKYLPFQNEIQQAILLISQKKYDDASKIIDDPKLKDIQNSADIIKLKMDIRNEKSKLVPARASEQEKEKWIFLRTTNQQENLEPSDWRIIGTPPDARLELSTEAVDPITMGEFVDSIKEAQDVKIPYILFALHNDDGFYHFVDSSYLQALLTKWKNPVRGNLDAVEIYVAGDDGKLTFLNLMKKNDEMFKFMYKSEKILKKSGEGHFLIAQFFRDRANYFRQRVAEYGAQEGQIALRHALQWYDWAIKYLPAGTSVHEAAKTERDKISKILTPELNQPQQSARPPKKPIPPQKPQEPPQQSQQSQTFLLIQNLQNLTRSFQKIAAALST